MIVVKHEGEYDAERNIVFCKFINKPKSFEDVDYLVNENEKMYKKGGENKVWDITDVTEMGMAPVKLITAYQDRDKPIAAKYVIDFCIICSKPFEKIATQLFNMFRGEKHPIFKTREEGVHWVLKEQETRGRFIPL